MREQQRPSRRGARGRPVRSEKGNPPRSNLRFGRYQVARRGRKSRAATEATTWPVLSGTERDGHHEQNSAYSPVASSPMVPLAQSAERRSVEPEVTGSSPVRHPTNGVTTPENRPREQNVAGPRTCIDRKVTPKPVARDAVAVVWLKAADDNPRTHREVAGAGRYGPRRRRIGRGCSVYRLESMGQSKTAMSTSPLGYSPASKDQPARVRGLALPVGARTCRAVRTRAGTPHRAVAPTPGVWRRLDSRTGHLGAGTGPRTNPRRYRRRSRGDLDSQAATGQGRNVSGGRRQAQPRSFNSSRPGCRSRANDETCLVLGSYTDLTPQREQWLAEQRRRVWEAAGHTT